MLYQSCCAAVYHGPQGYSHTPQKWNGWYESWLYTAWSTTKRNCMTRVTTATPGDHRVLRIWETLCIRMFWRYLYLTSRQRSHCQRSVTATKHTARFHNWIRVTLGALRTAQYSGQHSRRQNTHTKTPRCCAWRTHTIWLIPALQPLQCMSLKRARWSETKHNANIFTGPFTSLSIRRPLTRLTFKDKVRASSVCLVTQDCPDEAKFSNNIVQHRNTWDRGFASRSENESKAMSVVLCVGNDVPSI